MHKIHHGLTKVRVVQLRRGDQQSTAQRRVGRGARGSCCRAASVRKIAYIMSASKAATLNSRRDAVMCPLRATDLPRMLGHRLLGRQPDLGTSPRPARQQPGRHCGARIRSEHRNIMGLCSYPRLSGCASAWPVRRRTGGLHRAKRGRDITEGLTNVCELFASEVHATVGRAPPPIGLAGGRIPGSHGPSSQAAWAPMVNGRQNPPARLWP